MVMEESGLVWIELINKCLRNGERMKEGRMTVGAIHDDTQCNFSVEKIEAGGS